MTKTALYACAGGLSALWCLVHLVVGGRQIARLLLRSQLPDVVLQTSYLCWHLTTASLAVMSLLFGLAALFARPDFAVAGLLLAAGFVIAGVTLIPARGWRYAVVPQGWLFVPVVMLAGAGVWL